MDTKSKNLNYSPIVKTLAFFLVIAAFGLSVTMFGNMMRQSSDLEALFQRDYSQSRELYGYQESFAVGLSNLLAFRNEEYIRQGNTISKEELEERKTRLYENWYEEFIRPLEPFDVGPLEKAGSVAEWRRMLQEQFNAERAEEIKKIYDSMIAEELRDYYSLLQRVNSKKGLIYYATDGTTTYTNTQETARDYFAGFKAYYLLDREGVKSNYSPQGGYYFPTEPQRLGVQKIYIAATDDFLSQKQAEWDQQNAHLQFGLLVILTAVLPGLLALVYLLWTAGRKAGDEEIHTLVIDRLYSDVNLGVIITLVAGWAAFLAEFMQGGFLDYSVTSLFYAPPDFWLIVLYNMAACSIGLALLLSLVRKIKNKTLLKHTLVYTVVYKIWLLVKTLIYSGPDYVQVVVAVLFNPKAFLAITRGVQEIKKGRLDYVIDLPPEGLLGKLAQDINSIADGLKNAVAKEIKAERMKTELITNISHDLKTPLTSIISYADLLSKENLTPPEANDYVAVIKQKSERLKQLTQDLFEISRIQSGNIVVDLERIDLALLVKQALAEQEEQIAQSGLEFKVNIPEGPLYILADGKRLSRALENLIGNSLKYSLANTRVYIDLFTADQKVVAEIKNIANYEMNFREDEILERFVRGDQARSTEGHGLGLAIAQSNVAACGGRLDIKIDGDLFKASIRFDMA